VRFQVIGDAGKLPATVATPLAVVLTELLQNAVEHGYPDGCGIDEGEVVVELANHGQTLVLQVIDDGVGIADDFSVDRSSGLGLSIVRTLVTSELEGSIEMYPGLGDARRRGTVVHLRVPIAPVRAAAS
jgi:two-component sensor histidine kinase